MIELATVKKNIDDWTCQKQGLKNYCDSWLIGKTQQPTPTLYQATTSSLVGRIILKGSNVHTLATMSFDLVKLAIVENL